MLGDEEARSNHRLDRISLGAEVICVTNHDEALVPSLLD